MRKCNQAATSSAGALLHFDGVVVCYVDYKEDCFTTARFKQRRRIHGYIARKVPRKERNRTKESKVLIRCCYKLE